MASAVFMWNHPPIQVSTACIPSQYAQQCAALMLMTRGGTNPWRQVAVTTKFCTATPNIFGASVRNSSYVTLPAPKLRRWCLHFRKICAPLHGYTVHQWYQSFTVQLMHIYSLLKTIKIWEVLLQHVSVYTETIIRGSVSTLLKLHRWFIWLHSWPCGHRQYLAA